MAPIKKVTVPKAPLAPTNCYSKKTGKFKSYTTKLRCPNGTTSRKRGGKSGQIRNAVWTVGKSRRKCINPNTNEKKYVAGARCPKGFMKR